MKTLLATLLLLAESAFVQLWFCWLRNLVMQLSKR
mgnify:CR=1 FL=1